MCYSGMEGGAHRNGAKEEASKGGFIRVYWTISERRQGGDTTSEAESEGAGKY